MAVSDETRAKMRQAALNRSPAVEARRLAAMRANSHKISEAHKGKTPKNLAAVRELAWG